ncbi:DUF1800 domain-containing protein [Massilia sp. TWP1-3-3]|uniref:DUF1800 domain-containing protein n=1 Tax=Massilia sp. TWP1-3-3 TaxID=2804573 RepID=UPI003CEF9970
MITTSQDLAERPADSAVPAAVPTAALLTGALLSACGGGGGGAAAPGAATPPPARESVTPERAARFLAQASMGATREQIAMVQSLGYAGWLDEQFALPASRSRWDWLVGAGFSAPGNLAPDASADACQWRKLLGSHDTLRQRVTLALSEIVVAGLSGFAGDEWYAFAGAAFMDLLEANAFGNYRALLQQVSLSAPMGEYLTYINNVKSNPATGTIPDENYARELLQLYTIGVVQLNLDGTLKLSAGAARETYTQDDIMGLARVFTGWDYDWSAGDVTTPLFKRMPLIQNGALHESGSKTFLGTTIAVGTDGASSLSQALDAIFAHPNVAPFISGQLIQRLVTSNPSAAYVARVATVFNNDGSRTKGNLKAVIRAILLDDEARNSAYQSAPGFGKLREPILRLAAWARAFKVTSPGDTWGIGNTSDPATRLGQSPLRAPSVFNFFRPDYVPPNTAIARAGLVAPEFQITNESTVVGYVNFMQNVIGSGIGDLVPDYSTLLPLAETARALVDEVNLVLAAGQLSATTVALVVSCLDGMPAGDDAARLNRVRAALVMVMAAPEFIVQK